MIIIHKTSDPFARVPKSVLDDKRLSWAAKGILAYLLGKPDNWKANIGDIVNHASNGRFSVRSAMKELREAGYARSERSVDAQGRVTGWDTIITDCPESGFRPSGKLHTNKNEC